MPFIYDIYVVYTTYMSSACVHDTVYIVYSLSCKAYQYELRYIFILLYEYSGAFVYEYELLNRLLSHYRSVQVMIFIYESTRCHMIRGM